MRFKKLIFTRRFPMPGTQIVDYRATVKAKYLRMITNSRIHPCRLNTNRFTQEDHAMHQNKLKHERTNNRTEQVVTFIRLHLYNRGVCCGARAILLPRKASSQTAACSRSLTGTSQA